MNERFRELADEARKHFPKTEMSGEFWVFDEEKFAELIVNDCIQELEISRKCDPYTGDLYDCEYNKCIDDQINVLKDRFGVD